MRFPEDTKVGDLFWMDGEPIRVIMWGYIYGPAFDNYFDIEFLNLVDNDKVPTTMILIPTCWDFDGSDIRRMSSLEKELF